MTKRMLVGTVSLNNARITSMFLQSLYRSNQQKDADTLVIDNGSTDPFVMKLQQYFPETQFIRNDRHRGVAPAWNQLLQHGDHEFVAVCNNDLFLGSRFVLLMQQFMDDFPEVGVASAYVEDCRIDEAKEVQERYDQVRGIFQNEKEIMRALQHTYLPWANGLDPFDGFDEYCRLIERKYAGQYLPQILGSCLVVRRQVIEDIGLFEEAFTEGDVGVSEDFLYAQRLREHEGEKWKQWLNKACAAHHFSSQTRGSHDLMRDYYGLSPSQWEFKRHELTKRLKGTDLRP